MPPRLIRAAALILLTAACCDAGFNNIAGETPAILISPCGENETCWADPLSRVRNEINSASSTLGALRRSFCV